jgi:hypothetical protein
MLARALLAMLGIALCGGDARAQTYGQVIWGQQQNINPANIVIFDGLQNVAIGALNTVTHSFAYPPGAAINNIGPQAQNLFAMSPNGSTGLTVFRAPVSADFPANLNFITPSATTPATTDNSTNIATTAYANAILPCKSALNLAFVGDGATNNATAWSNFAATVSSNPGTSYCIQFPAGIFLSNSAAALTLAVNQNLTILGAGRGATWLEFSGAAGMTIAGTRSSASNGSTFAFKNFSFATTGIGTGTALSANQHNLAGDSPQPSVLDNIGWRGAAIASQYWGTASIFTDWPNIQMLNIATWGKLNTTVAEGHNFVGSASSTVPTVFNITNGISFFLDKDVTMSGYAQGLSVSQYISTGNNYGVTCNMTIMEPMCNIYNSQFNTIRGDVVWNNVANGIISTTYFTQGFFSGAVAGDAMINGTGMADSVIVGNTFAGTSSGNGVMPNCINFAQSAIPQPSVANAVTGNIVNGCATVYNFGTNAANNIFKGNNTLAAAFTAYTAGPAANNQFDDLSLIQPTITACGTSPIRSGIMTNRSGHFVTGSTATTSCTLNFAIPTWQGDVFCSGTIEGVAVPGTVGVSAISTTAVTFTYASATSSTIGYVCNG